MTSKPNVKIIRFTKGFKSVIGELYIDDKFFCYTLEREWLDNKRRVSCIPPGIYDCKPYSSEKYPSVTEITDVEGRDKILIHQGNFYWDIEGCILLGNSYKEDLKVKGKRTGAVYHSVKTLKRLFDKAGRSFKLEIIDNVNFDTNLSTKPKNKMSLSLLFLAAPLIKKLAIKGFDKLKGKVLDKAKETVVKKILEKTGINFGNDISDREKEIRINQAMDNLSPEQLLELKKEIIESDNELMKAELENQTEQTKIINLTMRAELKSDDLWQKRWRPFNGFAFGVTMFITLIAYAVMGGIAIFLKSPEMMKMLSELVMSTSPLIIGWSAVLGVSSYTRGKEKLEKLKRL